MAGINPLTFFGSSSIIDGRSYDQRSSESDAVRQEFLKLLLEKVYLKDFGIVPNFESEDEEDPISSLYSNQIGDVIINDLFRRQLADQLIDNEALNLDLETNNDGP